MSTVLGVRTGALVTAPVAFTTNVVLTTIGLLTSISANQAVKLRAWVPFSVGATGGVRVQLVVPAGGTLFSATIKAFNTGAATLITQAQAASAAFTNALANAGTDWVEVEAYIINGATAGNIDLQFAQNTSDANTLTVLRGGFMDITKF